MIETRIQPVDEIATLPCENCMPSSTVCLKGLMKAVTSSASEIHNDAVRTLVAAMQRRGSLTGVISCTVEDCAHSDRIGSHHLIIDAQ